MWLKGTLILRKSPKPPTTGNLPLQGSEKRPRQTRFQSKGGSVQGFRDQDSGSRPSIMVFCVARP